MARLKEAGQAAEPPAKTAWGNARDGAVGFGQSVKGFFMKLFSNGGPPTYFGETCCVPTRRVNGD